jgi:hypothetical protein
MAEKARLAAARFSSGEFAASALRFYEEVLEFGKIRGVRRFGCRRNPP